MKLDQKECLVVLCLAFIIAAPALAHGASCPKKLEGIFECESPIQFFHSSENDGERLTLQINVSESPFNKEPVVNLNQIFDGKDSGYRKVLNVRVADGKPRIIEHVELADGELYESRYAAVCTANGLDDKVVSNRHFVLSTGEKRTWRFVYSTSYAIDQNGDLTAKLTPTFDGKPMPLPPGLDEIRCKRYRPN